MSVSVHKGFAPGHFPHLHLPEGVKLEMLATYVPAIEPRFVPAPILRNDEVAPEHFLMGLRAPHVARGGPGQFVMVRPAPERNPHPLLPRPMALYRYLPDREEVEILYRVVGEGTRAMSERKVGEQAEVVGPVGRAFTIERETTGIVLVGRGIGVCSLTALAEAAARRGLKVYGLLSARNPRVVLGAKVLAKVGATYCAVNDAEGTSDLEQVRPWLEHLMSRGLVQQAYVCGANRLIALTCTVAGGYGVKVQVSLEAHMACGLGYCHGCATGAFGEREESPLVCRDGPVFQCSTVENGGGRSG
ncbi:MAG: dihydroorotate oxidase electron transfer subunit [Chloroflexi bacterium]|nr:dihydroorotate oxidase electron transfer subunit [Chloroflexota bacterium]